MDDRAMSMFLETCYQKGCSTRSRSEAQQTMQSLTSITNRSQMSEWVDLSAPYRTMRELSKTQGNSPFRTTSSFRTRRTTLSPSSVSSNTRSFCTEKRGWNSGSGNTHGWKTEVTSSETAKPSSDIPTSESTPAPSEPPKDPISPEPISSSTSDASTPPSTETQSDGSKAGDAQAESAPFVDNRSLYDRIFNIDNFATLVFLGLIAFVIGWLYTANLRNKREKEIEAKLFRNCPLDKSEVEELRKWLNLQNTDVLSIHRQMKEAGFENYETHPVPLETIMYVLHMTTGRGLDHSYLLERIVEYVGNGPTLPAYSWLLFLAMVSNGSEVERSTLVFTLLDDDDDGKIHSQDLEKFFAVVTQFGWLRDGRRLYRLETKFPPTWKSNDPKEMAEGCIRYAKDARAKAKTPEPADPNEITWEDFKNLNLKLL
eukprot:TRINITY_DN4071_c0_g1_i1.p1 TRINITY_DN4071_c0_g1~~TRINITY_DN4071_c0_g1_i1.p1  ORF type:complete len:495 (+),score=93.82 TRINITY_DN4071_c0_g1_i1:203-1486(+)